MSGKLRELVFRRGALRWEGAQFLTLVQYAGKYVRGKYFRGRKNTSVKRRYVALEENTSVLEIRFRRGAFEFEMICNPI